MYTFVSCYLTFHLPLLLWILIFFAFSLSLSYPTVILKHVMVWYGAPLEHLAVPAIEAHIARCLEGGDRGGGHGGGGIWLTVAVEWDGLCGFNTEQVQKLHLNLTDPKRHLQKKQGNSTAYTHDCVCVMCDGCVCESECNRVYLICSEGVKAGLASSCKVTKHLDGVRRAAEVRVDPEHSWETHKLIIINESSSQLLTNYSNTLECYRALTLETASI